MYPQNRIIICLITVVLFLVVPVATLVAGQDPPQEIVLAEGTPINVVTVQEITSKEAKPGDNVNFTVNDAVVINGHLVVRKGTTAVGSVITAQKGGYMGKSEKLAIQAEYTQLKFLGQDKIKASTMVREIPPK